VRRDGCPAERKVLEKSLRLLFTTTDLSAVKSFFLRQCDKLSTGRGALIDYVFASEVRLGTYKSNETAPPGAQVALHRSQLDPNDRVQSGERVPHVIIHRMESARLRDSAQRPEVLLFPPASAASAAFAPTGIGTGGLVSGWTPPKLNAPYYITKRLIPALDRIFSLIGVDVGLWYRLDMRRSKRAPLDRPLPEQRGRPSSSIGYYLESNDCSLCDEQCRGLLCEQCASQPQAAMTILAERHRISEARYDKLVRHCLACAGVRGGPVECRNLDCPQLYARIKLERQLHAATEHLTRADFLHW
jgi:DNA polymerase zeta